MQMEKNKPRTNKFAQTLHAEEFPVEEFELPQTDCHTLAENTFWNHKVKQWEFISINL